MMVWSKHPHAPYYLFALSFMESSFFPIPPDVMLAPMVLAKPQKGWQFAALTILGSVLGGILGYAIGRLFFEIAHPYIIQFGYEPTYLQIVSWFNVWGVGLLFIAGFIPIPYKLFTIASGVLHMPLLLFILGSCVARSCRFSLVTALMLWGGERMERILHRYVDRIGWIAVTVLVIGCCAWQLN